MADAALKTAPLTKFIEIDGEKVAENSKEHKFLSQEFDPYKRYVFELANRNPQRLLPVINFRTGRAIDHQPFKPLQNIVYTSQIVWNGRRRMVRYYDGCDSIFFDKQPVQKDVIDMLIRQTRRREFIYGKFACEGVDRMLLLYLFACSWNAESLFRTPRASMVFIPVNNEEKAEAALAELDEAEKAFERAKDATYQRMRIHSAYLGIPLIDYDSGVELTETELRLQYRKLAKDDPTRFNKSYGDEKIEIKFFINRAWETGTIHNKDNPNKVFWKSGGLICDISGLVSAEAITQRIFEFSQKEEGTEFLVQLKAISQDF